MADCYSYRLSMVTRKCKLMGEKAGIVDNNISGNICAGWQTGYCNDKSGADQNSGVKYLGAKDSKEQCLVDCKKEAGATGCEFHPQQRCWVHTNDVGAGS